MTLIHFILCSSFLLHSLFKHSFHPPFPLHTSSSSFLYRHHFISTLLSALHLHSHSTAHTLPLSLYRSHLHTHTYTHTTHTHPFLRCEEVLTSSCVNALVAVVFLGAVKPEFAGTYVSTAVQNKFFLIAKLVVVFHCMGRY